MKKALVLTLLLVSFVFATGCSTQRDLVTLTVSVQGQGAAEPEGTDDFVKGSIVELKAIPASGWQFSKWEGDVAEPFSVQTTVLMERRQTVTAIFVRQAEPEILTGPGGIITWRADGSPVARRAQGAADIEYIMLHAISDAAANPGNPYEIGRIRDIFDDYGVEAHYVIDRDGAIYQFVPDDRIARHAGAGTWKNDPQLTNAMNRYAIGIELLGIGTRSEMKDVIGVLANTRVKASDRGYTDAQYLALDQLLAHLADRYGIPRENIITHHDYDPGRKWDPGDLFDWSRISC
ncbi:MAG: N-acetylmuramoyl-L-alanine amidase [Bacillota bacterium]|jgi:hypothetical protein|nr:N-acetylmuramoyl-L-alanine amidase [Bacillota bacterium]NLJ02097.1 N-acetylmuramoyl-L-alanine amidase [Bacillota bacterium]